MDYTVGGLYLCLLAFNFIYCSAQINRTSEGLSVMKDELNGKKLVEMGKKYNISLLTLIGDTLVTVEEKINKKLCRLSPCAEWTTWSSCTAKYRSVGFKMRSRSCYDSSEDACAKTGDTKTETESRICDGTCVDGYNVTENNFCVQLNEVAMARRDAETACKEDGGHLMNVDTETRWSDLVKLTKDEGVNNVWIDGTRTVAGGNWNYVSGNNPEVNDVDHWKSGEPSNGRSELCKVSEYSSGVRYWFDRDCSSKYAFICEIRAE